MAARPPAAATIASVASGAEVPKKRHTLLTFGFVGTDFFGLQSQTAEGNPERPTISDVVRRALLNQGFFLESNFTPMQRSKWQLASRTDKGVHAACAAASVNIETHSRDLVIGDGGGAEDYYAATASVGKAEHSPGVESDWRLSDDALERINSALPPTVRVFSGGYVRKRFDPRGGASSRTYEYLLPLSAVGASAEELDAVLRRYEGSHRFHNFASGLRVSAAKQTSYTCATTGDEWPLALHDDSHGSAAWRSVITCRVHRELTIGGEGYLVLRIAGLAFVLHQIRHMVGGALAVTNGLVPADVFQIALDSPLKVDVAPLAPGMGLLLDEIQWFKVSDGRYEATVPPEARAAMDAFKRETIYPHIHDLYADGAYERFLDALRTGDLTKQRDDGAFDRLRRVSASHRRHIEQLAQIRREERAKKRAAFHQAERAANGGGEDGLARAAEESRPERAGEARRAGTAAGRTSTPKRPKENELPGGMLVQLCVASQALPGPEIYRDHQRLKAMVSRGELKPAQPYGYYLDARERWRNEERDDAGSAPQ